MFLVSTCPYCQTEKVSFNIAGASDTGNKIYIFTICNKCKKPSVFLINYKGKGLFFSESIIDQKDQTNIENFFTVKKIIRPPENILYFCPKHIPAPIKEKFDEAAQCHANDCIVASSIMLRLCLETVIKDLLKTNEEQERKLFDGIKTLSEKNIISKKIYNFAEEIRSDGNYAAHKGEMSLENLEDLFDFTIALLEDVYTQPKKLELSRERRAQRKKQGTTK